jgi:hypothetical protein
MLYMMFGVTSLTLASLSFLRPLRKKRGCLNISITLPFLPSLSLRAQAKVQLKRSKRKDLYAVLNVAQDASESEIKTAYRKAALRLHPGRFIHSLPDEWTPLHVLRHFLCSVLRYLYALIPLPIGAFASCADKQASKSEEEKATAEAQFKAVNEAYEVLSCPEKKQR